MVQALYHDGTGGSMVLGSTWVLGTVEGGAPSLGSPLPLYPSTQVLPSTILPLVP